MLCSITFLAGLYEYFIGGIKPEAGTGSSIESSPPSSLVCRVRRIALCSQGGMSFLGHIFGGFLYLFIHTEINPFHEIVFCCVLEVLLFSGGKRK